MTRILVFEGPRAPKRFQILWAAATGPAEGKERGPAVIRREARILDALDAISDPVPVANSNEPDRALKIEGGAVTLAQEDFDLLLQYTEKTTWLPRVARDVVDTWDWLSTAEKKE